VTDAQLEILSSADALGDELVRSAGMRKIEAHLGGQEIAFFPVGCGYLGAQFPRYGVMVVGSEFGTEKDVDKVLQARSERLSDPTWRPLLQKLNRAKIARDDCWFTNFALCSRDGSGSNSSEPSPWKGNVHFIEAFGRLFVMQVAAQRPRAIVMLGATAAEALAIAFPTVFPQWRARTIASRDAGDGAIVENALIGDFTIPIVALLVHPSKGHLNEKYRRFRAFSGPEAEDELLRIVASSDAP